MNSFVRCSFVFLCLVLLTVVASAQPRSAVQADRVGASPDLRATTLLRGHVPAWAVRANDQGAVPDDTSLRLTFVLSRSPELQASFTQLLADQQNPNSPSYHQWLTPQQVGERYGPTQHDLDVLTNWLGSQGLTVIETAPSRVFVSVVGPASTVAKALATSFHSFNDNGKSRMSATADPSIPAVFATIVSSISGLADTDIRPMHHVLAMPMAAESGSMGDQPQYTTSNGAHYVTPGDFATVFDVKAVYSSGYTGAGQKVAIIGRSRVASADITEFETNTGLATNLPNVVIPPTGVDPGISGNGDQGEATLDVDRVIGTAPGVQADLVVSSSGSGGIFTAAQYEVQTLLDPVMTISFGSCEFLGGSSGVSQWDTLFSQAASEGISVFVSSGDSGAATCDADGVAPPAYQLLSINYICSSSYATCVGGTEFVEGANPTQYWSTANGAGLASALGYIPEGAWNESNGSSGPVVLGGGGGASIYVPKPAWQTGIGVPADNARDVPDVSFPSAGHDGYFTCYAVGGGDCSANRFEIFFGTSAAAPGMAGVVALLNQKTGGSQGNLNPLLYRLASSSPSAFHDATPTSSGLANNCFISTPSVCNNSVPGILVGPPGLAGYALTTGYDQATGLGSLDVANFLNAAASLPRSNLAPTVLTVRESASTISSKGTVLFTAILTSTTAGTPTGTVQFYADGSALGVPVTLVSGTAITPAMPFTAAGNYDIFAVYSGDSTYASATAPGIPFTVTGLTANPKVTASSSNIPVGTSQSFSLSVAPGSGTTTPTGIVRVFVSSLNSSSSYTVPLSNGIATTPAIPFPTVGSYSVTADYLGDSVYSPSNSAPLALAVQKLASTAQLSATAGSIGIGGGKSYIATIGAAVNTGSTVSAPSGTVQLYSNGVSLGSPFAVGAIPPQGGQAFSPPETFTTPGTYAITAVYSGDADWQSSTASGSIYGLTLTVLPTPASYQVSAVSSSLSLKAGATSGNTDQINIPGFLGFTGTVNLNCSVAYNGTAALTDAPTCSLFKNSVTVNPDSLASTSITIVSTTPHDVRGFNLPFGGGPRGGGWSRSGETALCALLLFFVPLRRRSWRALAILLVFAVGFNALSGCSGGGGSSTTPPPPTPVVGTTTGNYTVSITASSNSPGAPVPPPVSIALTIN
jgi:pseudomonalisin